MTEDSYDRCSKRPIWILETPEPRDLKLRTQTLIPDTRHHAKNGLCVYVYVGKNSPLLPVLFSVFFSRTSLQPKRHIVERRIMAQNACSGARKCLLGVSFTLNHFWGFSFGKTPKFSTEMGIFHVKLKTSISPKRSQLGKKFQVFTIGNLERSFRIRHFYLPRAPPSGRNRDFTISGLIEDSIARKRCLIRRTLLLPTNRKSPTGFRNMYTTGCYGNRK